MPSTTKILSNILSFIKKYKFSILLFLYLLLIVYFQGVWIWRAFIFRSFNILSAVLILILLHILSKTKYAFPFSILITVILCFNAFFGFVLGSTISPAAVASIIDTNIYESLSVLSDIWVKALIVILTTGFLVFSSIKELKRIRVSRKKSLLVGLCLWIIIIPGYAFTKIFIREDSRRMEFKTDPLVALQQVTMYQQPSITDNIISLTIYLSEKEKIKNYKNRVRILPEGITLNKRKQSIPKIYIVMGESSNRNYWSAYGYSIQTTPFMDSLIVQHPNKVTLYEGLASAPITREAIPFACTFGSPSSREQRYTTKSIIDLANDAEYTTYWLSGQEILGSADTPIGIISTLADKINFGRELKSDDLKIVDALEKEIIVDKKQFLILHLNGSHVSYKDKSDKLDEEAIEGKGNKVDYLRTIHHTDRVLQKVYELAEKTKEPYIILYFSDHGEILGRGHSILNDPHLAEEFKTPILIINNTEIRARSIMDQYVDNNTQLLNNSNMIYFIAEILNYEISPRVKAKALDEGKYVFHMDNATHIYKDLVDISSNKIKSN